MVLTIIYPVLLLCQQLTQLSFFPRTKPKFISKQLIQWLIVYHSITFMDKVLLIWNVKTNHDLSDLASEISVLFFLISEVR